MLEAETTQYYWNDYGNDTIGNQIRDLPVCNAVSQPTASSRAPVFSASDTEVIKAVGSLHRCLSSICLVNRSASQIQVSHLSDVLHNS